MFVNTILVVLHFSLANRNFQAKIILPSTAPTLFMVLWEGNFLGKQEQSLQLVTITKKRQQKQ